MKRVLVSSEGDELTLVTLSDRGDQEVSTGPDDDSARLGNVYKGVVVSIEPRIQAAFVDFGLEWEGFLPVSNVHESYGLVNGTEPGGRPRIQDLLSEEQEVIVQLNRDKHRVNDFVLSTQISLPGRYVVLMPGQPKLGVSKKIVDEDERGRLRDILRDLDPPSTLGYVIRTDGVNRSKDEIGRDLFFLLDLWQDIIGRIRKSETPALLHAEYEWVLRELRGQLDGSVEELIVDDRDLHKRLKKALPVLHPEFKGELKLHKSSRPLLQAHGVGAV